MHDTEYAAYVARLQAIRLLSSPSLDGIPDASVYSQLLQDNFLRIGKLATENRTFLDSMLFPAVASEQALSPVESRQLQDLGADLISAKNMENLDLPILSVISEKLLRDAEERSDSAAAIRSLDMRMDTCYALMEMLFRVSAYPELADRFRQEGLRIGREMLEYLAPERFAALDMDSRQTVLTDARYMVMFYEGENAPEIALTEGLDHLERVLALSDDPFYRDLTPDFDWRYFRYRALNYYAKATDLGNARGFHPDQLERIRQRTEQFAALWESDPGTFSQYDDARVVRMLTLRNRWLAGHLAAGEYRAALYDLYVTRDPTRYDIDGIFLNLQLPVEALCTLDPDHLPPESPRRLSELYRSLIRYAFRMPNAGTLAPMLEYTMAIIRRFIELPGDIDFESMILQCMAALHPPTYIHSVMVAKLSRCLCGHLLDIAPQALSDVPGRGDREALLDFVHHAALCHDFGKLSIIDTIFVYGRTLMDMEFELIRTHPRTGAMMLSRHASTRAYADIALGHHRWYDNTQGYPADFDTSKSPLKPVIDLVLCADCLDAATDKVGRCYNSGETLDEFIREVVPACGTRYPPWLADLLDDDATRRDLRGLLNEGRRETYRDTYHLLKRLGGNE